MTPPQKVCRQKAGSDGSADRQRTLCDLLLAHRPVLRVGTVFVRVLPGLQRPGRRQNRLERNSVRGGKIAANGILLP